MTNLTLLVLKVYLSTNLVSPPHCEGVCVHPVYMVPSPRVFTNYVIGVKLEGTNVLEILEATKRGPWVK